MGYYSYLIPSSSSSIIPILIITFYLLIPIAFPIGDTELDYICPPNSKTYTTAYNQSRAFVVVDLVMNTASSPNDGFMNASFAWPLDDEWSYGLALCRGDVSPDDCKACVNNATLTLVYNHCPNSWAAIIWRDYCFLKYSDVYFFGSIDTGNKFSLKGDGSWNSIATENAVKSFMATLSQTASKNRKLYAFGTSFMAWESVTVYGVAQCTRDLSQVDSQNCLDTAINDLVDDKNGGRILFGSCNIRYETYNFLNN